MSSSHTEDDTAVAALVEFAGERPNALTPEDFAVHHSAALLVWKRQLRDRRRRRIGGGLALLAAALLLIVGARFTLSSKELPIPVQVATLERMIGTAEAEGDSGWRPLEPGAAIEAGTRLRFRGGASALRAFDASLRVAPGSRLSLGADGTIHLEAGRIYIDTEEARVSDSSQPSRETSIAVETALGVVRDIGTQFEVDLHNDGSRLEVRVRTGLISVTNNDQQQTANAGESLQVTSAGAFTRSTARTFGNSWDWIQNVSRPFALDNATLASYLSWLAAETGWEIRFADSSVEREATSILLRGSSTEGQAPIDTVREVLDSAGLQFAVSNGVLTIR